MRFDYFRQLQDVAGDAAAGGGTPPASLPALTADPEKDRLAADLARSRSENDQLRRSLTAPRPPAAPAPGTNPPLEPKDFYKDPWNMSAAVSLHAANETVTNAMAPMYDTLVATARNVARGTDPEEQALFDELLPDIELKMALVAPSWKQNATVWVNAFNVVKGEKFKQLMTKNNEGRAPAVHIRNGNGPSAPTPAQPATNKVKITDAEAATARKFGMTPEHYAQVRDRVFKTEEENPLGKIDGPGFFDGRITYRTEDLRKEQRDARRKREAAAR